VFRLAGRSQIGKQVDAVLAALRKGGTEAGAEAALYATVVGPMASVVSSKGRLTIVPDGPLYQLPFEMLGRDRISTCWPPTLSHMPHRARYSRYCRRRKGAGRPFPCLR